MKNLSTKACNPFFVSNFIGYCLLLGQVASGLKLILSGLVFKALLGPLRSQNAGSLLVEYDWE